MKVIPILFFAVVSIILTPVSHSKEATAESVEKLLAASNVQKGTELAILQMETMMKSMMEQSLSKQKLTPEQVKAFQKYLPQFTNEVEKILKEEITWKKLKEKYVEAYQKSFTQQEIEGLTAFYQSDAGKAFMKKMPSLQEETSRIAMERLPAITDRIKGVSEQLQKKIDATKAAK